MTRSSEGRMGHSKPLLPSVWICPDSFRSRLGSQAGGQRMMEADGHLLLVLHAPPQAHQAEREGRFFWRNTANEWFSSHNGSGPAALTKLLAQYEQELDKYDVKEHESRAARDYFELLMAITPLHRAIHNMQLVLQEAQKTVTDDPDLLVARDKADEIGRRSELLSSDVKYGLDYAVAARAEQQAEHSRHMAVSSHRLNVLAAYFFPLVTLSAVFGINLQTGMEKLAPPWPFVIIITMGVGLGFMLKRYLTIKPAAASVKRGI